MLSQPLLNGTALEEIGVKTQVSLDKTGDKVITVIVTVLLTIHKRIAIQRRVNRKEPE